MPSARASQEPARKRISGFQPAARVGRPERIVSLKREEDEETTVEDEMEESVEEPLTRLGVPDRRFKGHREDPPPTFANPEYRRASSGGVVGNVHVTMDGKPDRRFKENRALSDDEIMKQYAVIMAREHGIISH